MSPDGLPLIYVTNERHSILQLRGREVRLTATLTRVYIEIDFTQQSTL